MPCVTSKVTILLPFQLTIIGLLENKSWKQTKKSNFKRCYPAIKFDWRPTSTVPLLEDSDPTKYAIFLECPRPFVLTRLTVRSDLTTYIEWPRTTVCVWNPQISGQNPSLVTLVWGKISKYPWRTSLTKTPLPRRSPLNSRRSPLPQKKITITATIPFNVLLSWLPSHSMFC